MSEIKNKCSNCGAPVTNSISIKIKDDKFVKLGKFINQTWICDDCLLKKQGIKSDTVSYSTEIKGSEPNDYATSADVSPNTPPADKTWHHKETEISIPI